MSSHQNSSRYSRRSYPDHDDHYNNHPSRSNTSDDRRLPSSADAPAQGQRLVAVSTHPAHQQTAPPGVPQAPPYPNMDPNLTKSASAPAQQPTHPSHPPFSPPAHAQPHPTSPSHAAASTPISRRPPASYQAKYQPPPGYVPSKTPPVPEPPAPAQQASAPEEPPKRVRRVSIHLWTSLCEFLVRGKHADCVSGWCSVTTRTVGKMTLSSLGWSLWGNWRPRCDLGFSCCDVEWDELCHDILVVLTNTGVHRDEHVDWTTVMRRLRCEMSIDLANGEMSLIKARTEKCFWRCWMLGSWSRKVAAF